MIHRFFVALMMVTGCVHFPPADKSQTFTLLYQSNRLGELEPCGCEKNPYGGIDREANAVREIRRENPSTLYVDAGNSLAPDKLPVGLRVHYEKKAHAILEMLAAMGADVFAPGPADYQLGVRFLENEQKVATFPFVSTNVENATAKPIFERYVIKESAGVRVGFLSLTPPQTKINGFNVLDRKAALSRWLPDVRSKSDVVVLLSQLDAASAQAIAQEFKGISVIVGADRGYSFEEPLWLKGRTLVVDPHTRGYLLGRLDLDLKLPLRGFYSPEMAEKNRRRLDSFEERLHTAEGEDREFLKANRDRILANDSLVEISGGTVFRNELIQLDRNRYGEENVVSKLIEKYKAAVRNKALAE